jgi:AhpD family alkylhydroperoxidase
MSRINYQRVAPEAVSKLAAVTKYLESSSLDPLLRALVEIRVSQINGCVYCVDLHTQQARRLGETSIELIYCRYGMKRLISVNASVPL